MMDPMSARSAAPAAPVMFAPADSMKHSKIAKTPADHAAWADMANKFHAINNHPAGAIAMAEKAMGRMKAAPPGGSFTTADAETNCPGCDPAAWVRIANGALKGGATRANAISEANRASPRSPQGDGGPQDLAAPTGRQGDRAMISKGYFRGPVGQI